MWEAVLRAAEAKPWSFAHGYRHEFCLVSLEGRFPMDKALYSILALCLLSGSAHAEKIGFTCRSEESANMIASAAALGQEEAEAVTHPLLMIGECEYLSDEMFVYIVRREETFGTTGKITVVGVSRQGNGAMPEFFGLIPTEMLHGDDSI
jgi:hypothetical protein